MNKSNGFTISAFNVLLSIISVAIILPMISNLEDISFYVTVSVFVLGKFVELTAKIMQRPRKMFFVIYVLGIIAGFVDIGMSFFAFINVSSASKLPVGMTFNYILIAVTTFFCVIDLLDFIYYICKIYYTKQKLHQFD